MPWPASPLYVIADVDACVRAGWATDDFCRACIDGGARVLQLRAKHLPADAFLALIDRVMVIARGAGVQVIVNDRVDLARAGGAAGAHVGQGDLAATAARTQLGAGAIVGLSTHTLAQATDAAAEPVTYVAVGPVFDTQTKDVGYAAVGPALVTAVRRALRSDVPVVAIGGITLGNARAILDAGAAAVAVISDLLTADPAARVREYLAACGDGRAL